MCIRDSVIPALIGDGVLHLDLRRIQPAANLPAQDKSLSQCHAFPDSAFKHHAVAVFDPFPTNRNNLGRRIGDPAMQAIGHTFVDTCGSDL